MELPTNTELYLRTYINDIGTVTADCPLNPKTDMFALVAQNTFTLSILPSTVYPVFVYFNGVLQFSPDFYNIVGTAGTLAESQTGTLTVDYWY